jgi:hypothetical protein
LWHPSAEPDRDSRPSDGAKPRARPRDAALQKLLSTIQYGARFRVSLPLSPALLRLDPMFDPLRNDPRFQKLVAAPALK